MDLPLKFTMVRILVFAVAIIGCALLTARRETSRSRVQKAFNKTIRTMEKQLAALGAKIETVHSAFDLAHKQWAEHIWRINDVYVRLSLDSPHLTYEVAPSATGPWVELCGLLRDRAGVMIDEQRNNIDFIVLCTIAHVNNWFLVRSFLHDPGLDKRIAELSGT